MAKYRVEVSASADRQLRKLDRPDQIRVLRAAQALATDPFPPGYRKLQGYDDVFRIRVGVYRVLYSFDQSRIVVVVLKIGHRKDVYR